VSTTTAGQLTARVPALLRDTPFRRYWGAQTISMFGDQISSVALPLGAVLALRATPAEMGYLSALIWLPSLLFALHAGAWVDRRGRRRVTMIAADLGCAALLLVLYASRYLHVRPGELGLVLGVGAVGGVLGSLVTQRLVARTGLGRAYLIGCIVFPLPLLLVPLAGGSRPVVLGPLFAAEFISGFGVMILDISIGAIFAAQIPDRLRSRVTGAFQAVNYGTRPVGSLVGGALGTLIGPRPTLWIAAIGGCWGSCGCSRHHCAAGNSPNRWSDRPGAAAQRRAGDTDLGGGLRC
jgi:MFS family permease